MSATRRTFLRQAGGAALLLPLGTIAAAQAPVFAPPPGPMRYTRTFRREMADGAAMAATRFFTVRFAPQADGYLLDGAEDAAPEVTAPPSLEAFAQIERERRDTDAFPLRIDRAGRIVARPEAQPPQGLDRAVDEALHRIAAGNHSEDEQAEMRRFVLGLQQAATALSGAPPDDLFHPLSASRSESRDVALPDGRVGQVSLSFSARLDPATGLMQEAERLVLTRLADSERRTVERWTLGGA